MSICVKENYVHRLSHAYCSAAVALEQVYELMQGRMDIRRCD
jgi:hypothetical protein